MNDQVLLTFVVPCYNVERYVQCCLDSIYGIGLNENRFEVLCVNDCSPDDVNRILERNMSIHDNMRIIVHEENKGLSGARNTGIREARGEYIWFVDSDDKVIGNGVEAVLEKTVSDKLDVLCFNYCIIDDSEREISRSVVFKDMPVTDGYEFAHKAFPGSIVKHMGLVWRFMYRTDYLRSNGFLFHEHSHWEDTVFMPKTVISAQRIASVSDVFYAYRSNPDSISGVYRQTYPAQSMFDYSFCAGGDLILFSDEVKDDSLKEVLRKTAISKYVNGIALQMLRSDGKERSLFYEIKKRRVDEVNSLKPFLNWKSRVILMPSVGPLVAALLSVFYKRTHKRNYA